MYAFCFLVFLSCTNFLGIIFGESALHRIINAVFSMGLGIAAYQVWYLLP
jgi:hypothetical protein